MGRSRAGVGVWLEGATLRPTAADEDGSEGSATYDDDDKDGPDVGCGKDDIDPDSGGGGGLGGGGFHQKVFLIDPRASPFLRLDWPQIRQSYRVYVLNN